LGGVVVIELLLTYVRGRVAFGREECNDPLAGAKVAPDRRQTP
jgi:hypothetical protein